jgi:hypothetical protein
MRNKLKELLKENPQVEAQFISDRMVDGTNQLTFKCGKFEFTVLGDSDDGYRTESMPLSRLIQRVIV